ncbi:MAG: hypothetical protein M1436_05235 [Acidobacteria bacterium]|nr:hypothetical protein [Acidobacteriota bacterium]
MRMVLALAILLLSATFAEAEIINRIAVSVGNRVITSSDIDRAIRVTAFLNEEALDFGTATRRATADRLVEQKLVARELELSRYPAPDPSEIEPMMKALRARYPDEAAFTKALEAYGVGIEDVRAQLLWRLTFLRFVDMRFRPGVQVTDEDVRAYFEKAVLPAAQASGNKASFEEYRDKIEQKLVGERVDQDLSRWLEAARRRTRIEYREDAFQ